MPSTCRLVAGYILWLTATYPRTFDRRRPVPLEVGVFAVLCADPDRPEWATPQVVGRALAQWTRRPKYRSAVKKFPRRPLEKQSVEA